MDENNQHKNISRREFLKIVGISTAATTMALSGCRPEKTDSAGKQVQGEIPTDKMTMRKQKRKYLC